MSYDEYDTLRGLLYVAMGALLHTLRGDCPGTLQPDVRDPDCPACRAIMRAETMVNDFGRQEES